MKTNSNTTRPVVASRSAVHQFHNSPIWSGTTRTCPHCGLVAYAVDARGQSVLWGNHTRLEYGRDFSRTKTTARPCVAALLGVDRHRAMGLIMDLWHWAVDLGPKEESPTGRIDSARAAFLLAAALEWKGDPEDLVTALAEVELLERLDTGLRVRGLDRYQNAWDNRAGRSARAKAAADKRWGQNDAGRHAKTMLDACSSNAHASVEHASGNAQAMLGDAKTQTQTQTQKNYVAPMAPEPVAPPREKAFELSAQEPAEKKARAPSFGETLYQRMEDDRREACRAVQLEFTGEGWKHARQNTALGILAKAADEVRRRFDEGWGAYLDDASNASRDPPWSIGFFLASRSTWESKAMRQGASA